MIKTNINMRVIYLILTLLCPIGTFAKDSLQNLDHSVELKVLTDSINQVKTGIKDHINMIQNDIDNLFLFIIGLIALVLFYMLFKAIFKIIRKYKKYNKSNQSEVKENEQDSLQILNKWESFFSNSTQEISSIKKQINDLQYLQKQATEIENERKETEQSLLKIIQSHQDICKLLKEQDGADEKLGKNAKENNKKITEEKSQEGINERLRDILNEVSEIQTAIIQLQDKHEKEMKAKDNKHAQALEEEQMKSKAYSETVTFVVKDDMQSIMTYTNNILEIIDGTNKKISSMLSEIHKCEDEDLKTVVNEIIVDFMEHVQNEKTNTWISEMYFLCKTGLFLSSKKLKSNSLLNRFLDVQESPFNNYKYRLHKDFFADYASAVLVLYQKLMYIDKIVETGNAKIIKNHFNKNDYKEILKLIQNIEYKLIEVNLYEEYDENNNNISVVERIGDSRFANGVVIDIRKIGVNYGDSKNKTEIIKNEC